MHIFFFWEGEVVFYFFDFFLFLFFMVGEGVFLGCFHIFFFLKTSWSLMLFIIFPDMKNRFYGGICLAVLLVWFIGIYPPDISAASAAAESSCVGLCSVSFMLSLWFLLSFICYWVFFSAEHDQENSAIHSKYPRHKHTRIQISKHTPKHSTKQTSKQTQAHA